MIGEVKTVSRKHDGQLGQMRILRNSRRSYECQSFRGGERADGPRLQDPILERHDPHPLEGIDGRTDLLAHTPDLTIFAFGEGNQET